MLAKIICISTILKTTLKRKGCTYQKLFQKSCVKELLKEATVGTIQGK